ncbi:uncharacterized protein LOC108806011 [Raphanus sativus]|uniref:Uncharacterized protein LOC108806011 n=1 Tax=Raphanus sativus TaxID=3726 RepID=A0A6J0JF82_RAPSA|nr:uncharacterized protein LOC108806011 [Raphanus sativus]XP_018433523.1 uncharacterized protein LOC108806011 [Raphanus sativus]
MDPEDSKLDDPKDSRLDPDDSKVDPDDSRLDPSSKKRALESEGREEDKKRHNSEKLSDESPLASPSFAEWDSSDSETELEEYYIPNQLIIWNLHDETVKRDIREFFNKKSTRVMMADIDSQGKPLRNATVWFKCLEDTKEAFKKQGQKLRGLPVRMKRPRTNLVVLAVSGFEPGSTEEVIKGQLTTFFKSSGVIRKIFIPKDENTGQCLSFGYVFLKKKSTKAEQENLDEIGGPSFEAVDCTAQVRFREIRAAMEAEGTMDPEEEEEEAEKEESEDELVAMDPKLMDKLLKEWLGN